VVFFNFRGDRAIEISLAFEEESFPHFDRGPRPDVLYAGMMQYDGDTRTPGRYLVEPPEIERTLGEYMARNGITQLACAETQKFGHVTYFWNGNRSGQFDAERETYLEVPSDRVPFEQRPWMKAAEVTDAVLAALAEGDYDFTRINYANGDMVGHTGHLAAAVAAVGAVDLALARLAAWAKRKGAILVVTADHGNADQMFQLDPKSGGPKTDPETGRPLPLTSHTLNPVPFAILDPARRGAPYRLRRDLERPGLANQAATLLDLLGWAPPPEFEPSLLE
jgi:2,3-bisphosphoglycerate-independent phosphoglycerate mutase